MVSGKSPGPLAIQKRIPTKMDSGEISEVFVKRKKSTVRVDRHGLTQGDSSSLIHFYGIFLQGFLWLIILICLVLTLYLVYLMILPCVCTHHSVKVDSSEEACDSLVMNITSLASLPF